MKLNKLIAVTMAITLMVTTTVPAYAKITKVEPSEIYGNYIYTDNSDNFKYPLWIWVDGYCYYYQNAGTILKNTTTPDGYTVDSEGRWAVNGTVQTNGYGHYSMGTDVYAGKSDDEIWNLMKQKLETVFVNGVPLGDGATAWIAKDSVAFDIAYGAVAGNEITIAHNFESYGTFVTALIGASWSDSVNSVNSADSKSAYANESGIKEKTIKILVGDKVGQELFDYIRAHADKTSPGYVSVIDKNGNPIKGWKETGVNGEPDKFTADPNGTDDKTIYIDNVGDGIHASDLDFSAWQNRTTDYGKRFSVNADVQGIRIDVYNN